MRRSTTNGKLAKNRRKGGRHAAAANPRRVRPAELNKLVKRAALVAPTVAVALTVWTAAQDHGAADAAPDDAVGRAFQASHPSTHPQPSTGHTPVSPSSSTSLALRAAKTRGAAISRSRAVSKPPARPSHPAASGRQRSALHCSGSSVMLPANYATIVNFLAAHGYSKFAAAGIAGNMYQESKGNPESVGSGGGGLIGWTPLPPGFVTGNSSADLRTQLAAVLTYNQQWSQYIPALNAATSATQAADIYMTYFERPGIPAAANREGAAAAVASACGF